MTQMTIFDLDEHAERIKPLDPQAKKVATYLLDHYLGIKKRNASMKHLSSVFDLDIREIRRIIREIVLKTDIIIGFNNTGYYVASTEQEVLDANDILDARIKASIERRYANGFKNRSWIYKYLKEMEEKYPIHAEGQINVKGESESYIKTTLTEQSEHRGIR